MRGLPSSACRGLITRCGCYLPPYTNGQQAKRYMGAEDADEGLRVFLRDHWAGVADKYCDTEGVNLLVAHLFMAREGGELPEEPEDERPINIGGADAVYTSLIPRPCSTRHWDTCIVGKRWTWSLVPRCTAAVH